MIRFRCHYATRQDPFLDCQRWTVPYVTDFFPELADSNRYNELRLLIRHPSMGRLSPSPAFFAESLSICAEASRNILAIINRFRDFRQLECHPQVFLLSVYANSRRVFPP